MGWGVVWRGGVGERSGESEGGMNEVKGDGSRRYVTSRYWLNS